jgi:Glycosyl hydrolase family 3 N terminal domain./Glycosyl hydrolase family 3 C terminal domain.
MEKEIVDRLTLEEKASLCSGMDFWHTRAVDRLDLPSVLLTDGPHGLRKQKGQYEGFSTDSYESTCFPTASCLASSWDRELLREVGEALGEECLEQDVCVLLGPGANIKRSPLCGRNFEYFSEDPVLSGELAAALIQGIQSRGAGASLKHFAVNNQETGRMTIDAIVDERALREIYLAGFERAVKKGKPHTVMCSYNKINGTYGSQNELLLTKILREEWGFDGVVVSDWGAVSDRVAALKAGLDLEMPGPCPENEKKIVDAVKSGELDEAVLDEAAARIIKLVLRYKSNSKDNYTFDREAHHRLAVRAAAESAVLLKNEGGILPLKKGMSVALIGEFAKHPRYQGAGSSLVKPFQLDNAYDAAMRLSCRSSITYSRGYDIRSDRPDEKLIEEACSAAKSADVAVIMAGLTDDYESEGFDRTHMRMPASHNRLISEVAKANPNVVVVLCNGSPVEMPWIDDVRAVLEMYLSGEGGGTALWQLLYGEANPCGKLAETFPVKLEDCPSTPWFPMGPKAVEYRESIYVGYRYYDRAGVKPLFPFGHGLSYTKFEYSDLVVEPDRMADGGTLSVSFRIRNAGSTAGKETAQVYVRDVESTVFRPDRELKEFVKVSLEPGEEKVVRLQLDKRAFAFYDTQSKDWKVEPGEFEILVGASSRDIRLKARVYVESRDEANTVAWNKRELLPSYYSPKPGWNIPKEEFEALYGRKVVHPPVPRKGTFTADSTISEVSQVFAGRVFRRILMREIRKACRNQDEKTARMTMRSFDGMPLRQLCQNTGGKISHKAISGLVMIFNGKLIKGLSRIMSR